MQNLDVPVGSYEEFKIIYVSAEVMVAINTKRGTVGQSAGKVVQRETCISQLTAQTLLPIPTLTINPLLSCLQNTCRTLTAHTWRHLNPGYNALQMVALRNLRPSKKHYLLYRRFLQWEGPPHQETFLECIAGKRTWGTKKFHTAITSNLRRVNDTQNSDAVSISDEAFAIVLFENYRHKWIQKHENKNQRGSTANEGMDTRMYGKFTERNVGQSQFSFFDFW